MATIPLTVNSKETLWRKPGILIAGASGGGKSVVMKYIANQFINKSLGYANVFVTTDELSMLDSIRGSDTLVINCSDGSVSCNPLIGPSNANRNQWLEIFNRSLSFAWAGVRMETRLLEYENRLASDATLSDLISIVRKDRTNDIRDKVLSLLNAISCSFFSGNDGLDFDLLDGDLNVFWDLRGLDLYGQKFFVQWCIGNIYTRRKNNLVSYGYPK